MLNREGLLARVAGDQETLRLVVQAGLGELPARVAAVREAVIESDAERLRIAAHTLKGMAGTLSAPLVAAAACELESLGRSRTMEAAVLALRRLELAAADLAAALEAEVR